MTEKVAALARRTLDEVVIDDEASFRHVALYADLKEVLTRARYEFRVLPETLEGRWDRALLLNLTFWGATPADGGDVLVDDHLPADVVAHAAWHHLAAMALSKPRAPTSQSESQDRDEKPPLPLSVEALFLGEAIASAFDLYLVGRLLGHSPRSTFLETQVPLMAEAANAAGASDRDFEAMLQGVAEDPERAFTELRELLSTAAGALFASQGVGDALSSLTLLDGHRFAPLLHRYELSNWVLYARAYGDRAADERAREVDRALREGPALDWLVKTWVVPALAGSNP
jgi:hypothetical protein